MSDPLGLFGDNEQNNDPLGLFEASPKKRNATWGESLAQGFGQVGNMADLAWSTLAGGAAALAGDKKSALEIEENRKARKETRDQWGSPQDTELSFLQKAANAVNPLSLAASGLSPATTVDVARQAGESTSSALKAGAIDAAGNVAGMILPGFKQGGALVRASTGAAANAAQELVTKKAIQHVLDTEKGKQAFEVTGEDLALAGLAGGVMAGAAGKQKKSKPTTRGTSSLEALNQIAETKKAPVETGAQLDAMQRMAQQLGAEAPVAEVGGSGPMKHMGDVLMGIDQRSRLGQPTPDNAIEAMTRQLGGNPKLEIPNDIPLDNSRSGIGDLTDYLTTKDAKAAQAELEARQAALEMDVRRRVVPEQNARAIQELQNKPNFTPEMEAYRNQQLQNAEQLPLDLRTELDIPHVLPDTNEVIAPQYGAMQGAGRFDENGMPIRADLSMEAANLENPLQRNLWGDELGPSQGQQRSLTAAIDRMPAGPERQAALGLFRAQILEAAGDTPKGFNAAMNKQKGQVLIGGKKVVVEPTDTGFVAKIGDKVVGYLNSNITPEQQRMLGEDASVDMVKVNDDMRGKGVGRALYEAWAKANDGNVIPSGKTSQAAWNTWKKSLPGGVDKFVNQEAQRILGGADPQHVLGNIPDPEVAQRVQARAALLKKQGGAISPDVFLKDFPEFLGSKFKDTEGKLKLFYHGTSKDKTFTDIKAGKTGAWFTDDPEGASSYAKDNDSKGTKYNPETRRYEEVNNNPHVHQVYLNAQNPYSLTDADMAKYRVAENYTKFQRDLTEKAKNLGHDSIDWGHGNVTVFNPDQIKSAISPINKKPGFNFKKQGGGLLVDWQDKPKADVLAKVAGIRDKLSNLIPTKATPQEVVAASSSLPDVDQNILQRGINNFTKGGLYQAEKTNNPVIKFTVDKVLEADRLARADVRDYIHDSLAPAMRALSTSEMTEIAAVLNHADKIETPVTPEFLRSQGFSEKQVAFAEAHTKAMDASFNAINQAREMAGLKPISKRAAYSAMNFTGDFRKLVYKIGEDGEKSVVGVIGAKTAFGLSALEKKIRASNPEYEIEAGKPRYMGGGGNDKGGSAVQAVQRALELLSENNGEVKQFLDVLDEIKTKEAYNFLGANAHTKQKKGVFGSEGRKPWLSAEQNAKDFMDAQLQYAEAALRWGHLSNASNEIKQLLTSDLNMPNAKEWSESYLQNALGMNPSKVGRSLENAVNGIWEASGIGKTIPTQVQQYSRKAVNTLLLGLNPAFLSTNVVQPLLAMPAMTSFLKSRGVDAFATGYDNMARAGFTLFKEQIGSLSPLEKEAQAYAKANHVFGSDLVDTSSLSRKNAEFYLDKTGNFLASNVESSTRKMVYYAFVHMLYSNGLGKDFGLAHNLTDMAMNNYSPVERPKVFNALGPVGDMAANLSSYKHNELSRLAMFAREIGKEKHAAPFLTQIATSVVSAGLTGVIGFQEADWLYRQITKAMGAPDSLSRVVIDFSEKLSEDVRGKYVASHGVFSALGVDMSKRLGISDVIPNSLGEAAFPGGSKLVDIGAAGLSAMTDPSEMNLKRLAREAAPGLVTGPMDRAWFSQDTPQGELGLNRRTLEGQVIRTDADKMSKNLGFTGINESVMKQKIYDLEQQGIGYADLRAGVMKKMVDAMHSDGKVSPELIQNYMRYEGDPAQLEKDLIARVEKGSMSMVDAAKLQAMAAKTIPQLYQGQRTLQTLGGN